MKKTPAQYLSTHDQYVQSFVYCGGGGSVTYKRNGKNYTYSGMTEAVRKHQAQTLEKIKAYYYAEFKKQHNIV